jgi:hypothetical protein
VAATSAVEWSAQFSPDSRWIAYESNESGQPEVYVVSFPEIEGRRQISTGGGMIPRWAETSGELFYWQDSTLMAVGVSTDGEFRREAPMPLFHLPDIELYQGRWDVTADGKRVLVTVKNPDAPAREIHVVLNWDEELKAKVGS